MIQGSRTTFSVGIPAFNQGVFLETTLKSILAQELMPFEVVVSDNHSNDETKKILESYEKHVRIIKPDFPMSMADHWNFVASNLSGAWFTILCADDVALPRFVKVLTEATRFCEDSVLVRAPFELIDQFGKKTGQEWLLSISKVTKPPNTLLEQLRRPKTSFASFAVKRTAFEAVGGFPKLNWICDWGLWLKLSTQGTFVRADQAVSQYRHDYRPNLMRERIFGFVEDEQYITERIIPVAASMMGISGSSKLKVASRYRAQELLVNASHFLPFPETQLQRLKIADLLQKRLSDRKGKRLVGRFLAGETLNQSRTLSSIKRLVQPLVKLTRKISSIWNLSG